MPTDRWQVQENTNTKIQKHKYNEKKEMPTVRWRVQENKKYTNTKTRIQQKERNANRQMASARKHK